MKVSKIVFDKEEYKVKEHYNVFQEDEEQTDEQQRKVGKPTTNIVYPEKKDCTCGKWKEFLYPCRHACRYFKIILKYSFSKLMEHHVHYYYRYGSMIEL